MSTPAPPNASAATPPPAGGVAVSSLVDALNNQQKKLKDQGKIRYPDEYSIEFVPEWVGNSTFQKPGNVDFRNTSMAPSTGTVANANRATPDPSSYSRAFDGGQSIAFVINRIMMESSYVYNQQTVVIDKDGKPKDNGTPAQNFAWYNILCFASPTFKWDDLRRDWAYKIKYVIVPYETPVVSEYFPNGRDRGSHKIYNYWFTGQNNEVLNYEVINNNAYYNIINTPTAGTKLRSQFDSIYTPKAAPQARTSESDQGAAEKVNDLAAGAADWLYNAVDYAEIRLRILGDPAWINAENYSATTDVSFAPFRDDGSINFSTGPAYFTINYNLANDYNIETGLMDIQGLASQNLGGSTPVNPALSFNYTAVECRSTFRQGRFEQELVGRLRLGAPSDKLGQNRTGTAADTTSRVANPSAAGSGTVSTSRQPVTVGVQEGIAGSIPNVVVNTNQSSSALINDPTTVAAVATTISDRPFTLNTENPPVRGEPAAANATTVGVLIPNPSTAANTEQLTSNGGQNMQREG